MRVGRAIAVIGVLGMVAFVGTSSVGAGSDPPVTLSGETNDHGTKDLSASPKAKLKMELDDFYFDPTFVKVSPNEKLVVRLENEGDVPHTFTSSALGVDKTVAPGKTAKVKVTVPASAETAEFFCNFHRAQGMQGALYTDAASTGAPRAAAAPATVSSADTRVGKVLVDANGRTLYMFDRDAGSTVSCTGQCAATWPPLVAAGTPTVGAGLDASKVAVVSGPNGSQVTYAGHPLYLYSGDQSPGDVAGQGLNSVWWVLGTDGNKIM